MSSDGISLGVGFVFTINIVIGAGFLSLPYAFQETGIFLSLFYLFLAAFLNNYLSLMFLEVIHKVKHIKSHGEEGFFYKIGARDIIWNRNSLDKIKEEIREDDTERTNQMDISKAISILFGKNFGFFYLIMLTLCFEGSMIAYSSIFASSFTSNVPLGSLQTCDIYLSGFNSSCIYNYWIFLSIYSIFAIYFSLKGLKEQKSFQILMCCMRFFIMSLVIICSFYLILSNSSVSNEKALPSEIKVSYFNFSQSGVALPMILFALLYQLQLPSVAELVRDKERNLWKIVILVTLVTLIFYGTLGLVVPLAINNVDEQCSLSFRDFLNDHSGQKQWWATLVSYIIVLFPAVDVISSFPLISIALADNWKNMLYGEIEILQRKVLAIRLAISILPLLIAAFFYNIVKFIQGTILKFIGLIPLFLLHFMVPVSHISVRMLCDFKSCYDVKFYFKWLNLAISAFAGILGTYLFISLLSSLSS